MRGTYWLKGPFWRRIIEGPLHQQNQVLWDRPPNAAANLRGTKKRVSFRILSEECDKFFATRLLKHEQIMKRCNLWKNTKKDYFEESQNILDN
ncbi:uncharacterized protein LOC144803374 isoform X2 [Lissotriton helveticus]